jgi:hypothetical protein
MDDKNLPRPYMSVRPQGLGLHLVSEGHFFNILYYNMVMEGYADMKISFTVENHLNSIK